MTMAAIDLHMSTRPAPYTPHISNRFEQNDAIIAGSVAETPSDYINLFGEDMIPVSLHVLRLSGTVDEVEILIPVRVAATPTLSLKAGDFLNVYGKLWSIYSEDGEPHLFVVAVVVSNGSDNSPYINKICLTGAIRGVPTCRTTYVQNRTIASTLLTVIYSDDGVSGTLNVPLVFWGKAAEEIERYKPREVISIVGRMQSRMRSETDEEGNPYTRIVHEVSVSTLIPIERNLVTNNGIF